MKACIAVITIFVSITMSFHFSLGSPNKIANLSLNSLNCDSLLKAEHPLLIARSVLNKALSNPHDTNSIDKITASALKNIQEFDYLEQSGFYTAKIGGQTALIKRLQFRPHQINEALWLQALNLIGLGPRLFGITKLKGSLYIVVEFISDSIDTKKTTISGAPGVWDKSVSNEIRQQILKLFELGIYPLDIQFVISTTLRRVVLIDPELFMVDPSLDSGGSNFDRHEELAVDLLANIRDRFLHQ